jgi:hypothetical protein
MTDEGVDLPSTTPLDEPIVIPRNYDSDNEAVERKECESEQSCRKQSWVLVGSTNKMNESRK